jgi:hypothetical protein
MDRHGFYSTRCDQASKDVHHLTYARLGQERLEDLIDVCRVHHIFLHMDLHCDVCGDYPAVDEESCVNEISRLIADYGDDDIADFWGTTHTCWGCREMFDGD